ncbi:MAG: glutathione S-transferase family protein, partial [Bdellovibrionales bacterium]|nr:glutathione S-transferase family protein [Bdellovibrionales bacterium]
HLGFLNAELENKIFFVGNELSGADIQLSFVAQIAVMGDGASKYPNLARFVDTIEKRPAYQQAISKHGK